MNKSKAIFASVALVAVALAPLALAHNDKTDWALAGTAGLRSTLGTGNDRVAGVYYKDVSLLVDHVGDCLDANCDDLVPEECAGGDPEEVPEVCAGVGSGTSFTFGVANALCDMEVLSPGDGTANEIDEPEVDGKDNAASLTTTLFNDGGIGAVCHTHTGYYLNDWNTAGCGASYPAGAKADDLVLDHVYLTTVCDYAHGTGGFDLVGYLGSCVNTVLTADVDGLTNCVLSVANCVLDLAGGLEASCPLTSGFACGPDEFGQGGTTTPGNAGWGDDPSGVAFENVPADNDGTRLCNDDDGAATVFVWTAVFANSVSPGDSDVSVPTIGVIY